MNKQATENADKPRTINLCPTPISEVEFHIAMMVAGRFTEDQWQPLWDSWSTEQRNHFGERYEQMTGQGIYA